MPAIYFKNNLMTQKQADAIVDKLVAQCDEIALYGDEGSKFRPNLYDSDYAVGRKLETQQAYAAFKDTTTLPDMTCYKRFYGKGRCLPEFRNDTAFLQLYPDSTSLKNDEITNKCKVFNRKDSARRFGIIKFKLMKSGRLETVELLTLDSKARVIKTNLLYKYSAQAVRKTA